MCDNGNYLGIRIDAFGALRRITGRTGAKRFLLAKLLGHADWVDSIKHFNAEDAEVCKALCGPHGHTVFRLLLLKQGIEDCKNDYDPRFRHA